MSYLFGKYQFKYYLTYNSVRTEIVFSPESWEKDSRVSNTRNPTYFGVFRAWGLPLNFTLDGAAILRQAYYNRSIQAGVRFEVEELNVESLQYENVFTGDIDFSGAKDNGGTFSVTLMQSGSVADIMAYDDLKFEFPFSGSDVVNVILPGVAFEEAGSFIISPTFEENFNSMPAIEYVSGLTSDVLSKQSTSESGAIDTTPENGYWFLKANRDQKVKLVGNIKGEAFTRDFQGSSTFIVEIRAQGGILIKTINSVTTPAVIGSTPYDFPFEHEQDYDADTFLYFTIRGTGDGDNYVAVTEGKIDVSFSSVSDPSNCKGILAYDLFKRVMAKVSPGALTESYFLKNNWKNLVFTSGDAIREISTAKLKFSLKDLYKTFNSIDDAGFGIENGHARLELASYFTRMIEICNVGNVSKCEIRPAQTYMMSKISIGYKDGNTDDNNGKQEYNSGQMWQSPITRVNTTEDWISPARADQYGIEKIRVEYNVKNDKKSYDTGSDNDTFILDTYKDGDNYRPILGSSYQSVTGLTSPLTAYNLNLSPKHNLLRKGAFLHSVLDKMDNLFINFASGDKNTDLQTVKDSIIVKENQNIAIASLPPAYFIPHFAKISCKLPSNAQKLFKGREFGYITFEHEGCVLRGFIMNTNIDVAKNAEQEFELLLTANSDLGRWANRVKNSVNPVF